MDKLSLERVDRIPGNMPRPHCATQGPGPGLLMQIQTGGTRHNAC